MKNTKDHKQVKNTSNDNKTLRISLNIAIKTLKQIALHEHGMKNALATKALKKLGVID